MSLASTVTAVTDQMFAGMSGVLRKAAAHAAETGVEESVYLNWRLAPDMLPLVRQVRIATEQPARALSRALGAEMPSFADDEEDIAALLARIEQAHKHIKALPLSALDDNSEKLVTFPAGPDREMTLPCAAYVQNFILPNFYFHVTTTYNLIRQVGVSVGKADFLAVPSS